MTIVSYCREYNFYSGKYTGEIFVVFKPSWDACLKNRNEEYLEAFRKAVAITLMKVSNISQNYTITNLQISIRPGIYSLFFQNEGSEIEACLEFSYPAKEFYGCVLEIKERKFVNFRQTEQITPSNFELLQDRKNTLEQRWKMEAEQAEAANKLKRAEELEAARKRTEELKAEPKAVERIEAKQKTELKEKATAALHLTEEPLTGQAFDHHTLFRRKPSQSLILEKGNKKQPSGGCCY